MKRSSNPKQAAPPAALVTGAARRIGRAIALDLGRQGWRVAVHYHGSKRDADGIVAEIVNAGGSAQAFAADLGNTAKASRLLGRAAAALGPLSLLVNNAAIFERDEPLTATPKSWDAHLDINLKAPFFLSQAFARQLPAKTEGNIINLIDMRVWRLTPHFTSYTLSKSGLWAMTQMLALAFAPHIRVNGIGPGPVLPSPRQSAQQFARSCASTPLGRGASPEEIATAVRFILASPAMTGQMIALDGGQHLTAPAGNPTQVIDE
jgi:NAD(P)-dependent dehydrogenase (short-subunit alcohol dehydrogenase family)